MATAIELYTGRYTGSLMNDNAIDLVGDPAVVAKVVELAIAKGLSVSKPMPTESIGEALDAPFGVDEGIQVAQVVTVIVSSGMIGVVEFLEDIKSLLGRTEPTIGSEPVLEVRPTRNRQKVLRVSRETDVSSLDW
jgi:hypothetical protein